MPIHTVRRGDSLWGLAHRYLGNGAKWPAILDRRNREAAKPGRDKRLIPIKDHNLIYVGKYIMIPGDCRNVPPGTGGKCEANQPAKAINLKVSYTIGRDTPPVVYTQKAVDFTVTGEMSGEIGIELKSADRFRHSLELLMAKNPFEAKYKLEEIYDPAVCALTAKPEFDFDGGTGKVKVEAPIAAKAGLGPYTVEVQTKSPLHLTGKLKPPGMEGTVEANGWLFRYSAEPEFKVDVVLEPKPRGRVEEPVRVTESQIDNEPFRNPTEAVDWQKIIKETKDIVATVTIVLAGAMAAWYGSGLILSGQTTSMTPFMHTIDPNDPRNLRYATKNPGMIWKSFCLYHCRSAFSCG